MLSGANGTSLKTLKPGQMVGKRYKVVSQIGQGGMGTVYEVTQAPKDRRCALKMLHPDINVGDVAKRFLREIQLGVKLSENDNIAKIIDYGTKDDVPYFVMEMLTGEDLGTRLEREGAMTFEEAYPILTQVIGALEFAHNADVVHRDLKPDNIFLCSDGMVKILDFGIAKITEDASTIDTLKTQDVAVMGTPHYMSPEQASGFTNLIDHRTDIFALGAIVYQMLSGQIAFDGTSANEVIINIATGRRPEDILKVAPNVPPGMHDFIETALAKAPEDRFQSMGELGKCLFEIHKGVYVKRQQTVRSAKRDYRYDAGMVTLTGSTSCIVTPQTMPTMSLPKSRGRAKMWITLGFLAAASGIGAAYYFDEPHVKSVVDRVVQTLSGKKKD